MNKDHTRLPNFDQWWDYNKPKETESKFREILQLAEDSSNIGYYIELLTQIARAEGLQGNFEQAHATLDEAKKLLEPALQRPKIRYLLERGRLFNSSKNPGKAEPLFMKALEVALDIGEESLAVDAAHMVAIVKPLDQQLEWNLRAMKIAEEAKDEKARGWLVSLYNNIGYTYLEQQEFASALTYFNRLLAYCLEREDEKFAAIARWFIAKTNRLKGNLDEALAGQLVLREYYDSAGEKSAYTYEELGECYLALGNAENRRLYFRLAYETFLADPRYNYVVRYEGDRISRIKELAED